MVFRNSPKIKPILEFGQSHLTENLKTKPTKKDSCHLDYYFKSYGILKLAQNSVFKINFYPTEKRARVNCSQTDRRGQGTHPSVTEHAREQGGARVCPASGLPTSIPAARGDGGVRRGCRRVQDGEAVLGDVVACSGVAHSGGAKHGGGQGHGGHAGVDSGRPGKRR